MRTRPASRLIIQDPQNRVLLFRFLFDRGPLSGQDYWATPGGGLENGETFEGAARRELKEETGLEIGDVGSVIGRRNFALQLPDGETVMAEERFFRVDVQDVSVSRDGWTALETQVMKEHHWWTRKEIAETTETIYPEDILLLLEGQA